MAKTKDRGKIGILMGGGPAPGINGVIHSATIEAVNNGYEVIGIYDGFKHLIEGELVGSELTINDVSRIHWDGGSIIHTSRANPTTSDEYLNNCVQTLMKADISYLIAIGGDDTAYSAYRVSKYAKENMDVNIATVHVPKTIDNDLPLPDEIRTFGFETARQVGTTLVKNIMEDARTGQRWFLVVTMGRKAGHLALGIGKSAGATVTLIPEEWKDREIRMQEVVDILITSLLKRMAQNRPYGVALVAEGVIEQICLDDLENVDHIERDAHGHIRLSEINFADMVKRQLRKELLKIGIETRIVSKDVGYELRCADPIAFDIDYTRSLGEAAVEFLLSGGSHATITIRRNQVVPIPFDQMMDPATGRTEVRIVDINSFTYKSAYKFMIRLKPEDAKDDMLLARMASFTNLSVEEFKKRFGYLIKDAPRPY